MEPNTELELLRIKMTSQLLGFDKTTFYHVFLVVMDAAEKNNASDATYACLCKIMRDALRIQLEGERNETNGCS